MTPGRRPENEGQGTVSSGQDYMGWYPRFGCDVKGNRRDTTLLQFSYFETHPYIPYMVVEHCWESGLK